MGTPIKLYNTLTRSKVDFKPIDPDNVRMYVCGPTVYDFAHIGNARPAIVFDVLYRLLRHVYDASHVTYVRNITDVDDKINARALRDYPGLPLNEAIRRVTEGTEAQYKADTQALGCLTPTVEPRATENIAEMIRIIEALIARGHAYAAGGEVLFDTRSMADYGQLSKRNLDEQQAGARIAVEAHKKHSGDFVLWKLSTENEPGWDSPWGRGRPGWHIECSAMSRRYLGETFDIHGGGLDLIFPHHENEIAQSRCAHGTDAMANIWMHNGFLQIEGRKMSKSDGNFFTIRELLDTDRFGGRTWPGEVLRLAMLMTHYREPIDFSVKRLEEASIMAISFRNYTVGYVPEDGYVIPEVIDALSDDLNTPMAIQAIRRSDARRRDLAASVYFLGLENQELAAKNREAAENQSLSREAAIKMAFIKEDHRNIRIIEENLDSLIRRTTIERQLREDYIRKIGILQEDLDSIIETRLELLKAKNFAEADKIRDELADMGIQLKDGKDPVTGERRTDWEVKR